MGWSNGNVIADELYRKIKKYVPKENRQEVATLFYETFSDYDADDWNENDIIVQDAKIKFE